VKSGKPAASATSSEISDNQKRLENNKAVVLKLYQALNDTNWKLAATLVDKDFKHHYLKDTGFSFTPWSGFEEGYRASQKGFPDWKLTPITVVAEGEYVSVLLRGEGTHLGKFAGIPPTKVRAIAPIMLLHQIKNGKIVADWELSNTSSFLNQLKKE